MNNAFEFDANASLSAEILDANGFATARSGTAEWRIWHDFAGHVCDTPNAAAIRIEGRSLSYGELFEKALCIAKDIDNQSQENSASVTAIYADRSLESYAGVLAASMMGHAYVPINPKFPNDRNQTILELSGATSVVCSHAEAAHVKVVVGDKLGVALVSGVNDINGSWPHPTVSDKRAYILFTSGSTGLPKGVPITHANVDAYLTAASRAIEFGPDDRFSQNFDLTFDLSVHDMFLCWRAGGELVVPSLADLENPGPYIEKEKVTCWFSVPSLAQKMSLQNTITPEFLGQVRISLFCGEALPLDLARKWQAATGTRVENWYGPTEATIACTRFELPDPSIDVNAHLNLTPIGTCLAGMSALVLDDKFKPVADGDLGELFVAGPQVASGYLNDAEKTDASFVSISGYEGTYYRTGDRVKTGSDGEMVFVDRLDTQIKIRGYRVEIGEIEAVLRDLTNGCTVIVTSLPLKSPIPTALVATIEGWDGKPKVLLKRAASVLPAYMIPTTVRKVAVFPKNASGKVDRGAIGQNVARKIPTPDDSESGPSIRLQLINMAIQINPALTRGDILEADDLMQAGLDSIAFTEFTMQIEKVFGLELDQNLVAEMAEMTVKRLARFIRSQIGPDSPEENKKKLARLLADAKRNPSKKRKSIHYISNRTVEFIEKFPKFVEDSPHPLALFIGSSGVMTGIDTKTVESQASKLGRNVSAANLGMQKLSNLGTCELIEFVRDTVEKSGKEVAAVVYEMEVMQLSSSPIGGVIELVRPYLDGDFPKGFHEYKDNKVRWLSELSGTIGVNENSDQNDDLSSADWNKKREIEVIDAYLGDMNFQFIEVDTWVSGANIIRDICPKSVAFIHPIESIESRGSQLNPRGDHMEKLLEYVSTRTEMPILRHSDINLEFADYRNYNHVNRSTGQDKLSSQLIKAALGF